MSEFVPEDDEEVFPEEEEIDIDGLVEEFEEEELTIDEGATEIDSRIFAQEDEDAMESTDHQVYAELLEVDSTKQNTIPYMTKFEYGAVKGLRSQQLSQNAPPMISAAIFPKGEYPVDDALLAAEEIRQNKCPVIISRPFPNGTVVRVPVSALKR